MRITDLDASFVGKADPAVTEEGFSHLETVEGAQGVIFQCPKCSAGKPVVAKDGERYVEGSYYVLVWFLNPRNAPRVPDSWRPRPGRWTFSGETLETLTLVPSVNLDVQQENGQPPTGCRWHGWVTNGEAS